MNAIFGNEPRRSEATLLSPFQGVHLTMARVPGAACVAQRRPYPWLKTDAPSGACLPWRPHSTNPAIADAARVPAVSDCNSGLTRSKLPCSESSSPELVKWAHE